MVQRRIRERKAGRSQQTWPRGELWRTLKSIPRFASRADIHSAGARECAWCQIKRQHKNARVYRSLEPQILDMLRMFMGCMAHDAHDAIRTPRSVVQASNAAFIVAPVGMIMAFSSSWSIASTLDAFEKCLFV